MNEKYTHPMLVELGDISSLTFGDPTSNQDANVCPGNKAEFARAATPEQEVTEED